MKVQFKESYTVAIDGINIVTFEESQIAELPQEKAELYISRGVCFEVGEQKQELPAVENKAEMPVVANKKKGK